MQRHEDQRQQAGQTTPRDDEEAPAAPDPAAEPSPAVFEPPKPQQPARSSAEIGTSGQSVPTKPVRAGLNTEPEVVTPDGSIAMPVQTVLVELEDLVHATGDLRASDRAQAETDQGVQYRAANLDPLRLLPERVSDSGAPVITQDGTIVSGNGRVQSIREVYSSQGFADRAQVYRSTLGGEAEGMKHPVLVRKIQGNPSAEELVQFAQASNQPAGVESTEEIAAKIVDTDADATATEDGGTPAAATETAAPSAEPSPFTPTEEQRAAFSEVLAGNAPRREWQNLVGATPEQIETLEREAVDDGRLRVRKNGKIGRTGKAKKAKAVAAAAPTVAIPADARLDNAIAAREAEGAIITQPIAEYAWRVELVRGDVKQVQALIEEINNDKSFDKSDVLELAHLVGYAPKSRTTKAQALESIVQRSKDLADIRDLDVLPAIKGDAREAPPPIPGGMELPRTSANELGFYSQAIRAAQALKQKRGTPEQMLAQLKKGGLKQAEIEATGLDKFLEGEKSVTKDGIVAFLELNNVEVLEASYVQLESEEGDVLTSDKLLELGDQGVFQTKWSEYSLDPSNPTYRETVLHLPRIGRAPAEVEARIDQLTNARADIREEAGDTLDNATPEMLARYDDITAEIEQLQADRKANHGKNFRSGHWSEPNVIAHMRTSVQSDANGKSHFVLNELQSDWGQKIRDAGGVRDEAKIAALLKKSRRCGKNTTGAFRAITWTGPPLARPTLSMTRTAITHVLI